jgi:glycosyltransferase involved in cell wall biosynthesis
MPHLGAPDHGGRGADGGGPPPERTATPRVSVVMPAHGEARDIGHQLAALSLQTYPEWWEVIVADNGCSPAALAVVGSWATRVPNLRIVTALGRRGANHARNRGVAAASGQLLVFCDADDVVATNWLEALCRAAVDADLVGGHVDVDVLNGPPARAWRESLTVDGLPEGHDFLPHVVSANCAIWRDVYEAAGGWDEDFPVAGDDVDLSWRVQLDGGKLTFAPDAVVYYRLRPGLLALARQMVEYGMAAALLYKKFRDVGAQRPPAVIGLKYWARLLQQGPAMITTAAGRGRWVRDLAYEWGRLRGGLRHRVLFW